MIDALKILITLLAYFGLGPALGYLVARSRKSQRVILALMTLMPCLPPGKLTLMIFSIEEYRGHTKGFEANWIEVLGLALILANTVFAPKRSLRPMISFGVIIYLLWCFLCALSLIPAFDKEIALMGVFKFTKPVLILAGVYHVMRDEEDLRLVLEVMAWALIIQVLVALKQRYLDGQYKSKGWFEHQNSMGLWAYMSALPLLAVAMWKKTPAPIAALYLTACGSALVMILLTVSRACLAAYLMGCALIMAKCWLFNRSGRLTIVTLLGTLASAGLIFKAKDTYNSRLDEIKTNIAVTEVDVREIMIQQAEAMLNESFFGIGWNNYGIMNSRPHGEKISQIMEDWDEARGFTVYEENYYNNALTESLYWLLLAENGWPGLIGFALFLGVTVWWCIACVWTYRGTFYSIYAYGVFVTFVCVYIHSKVERILTQTKNISFWLVMCGIMAALYAMRREAVANRRKLKAPGVALPPTKPAAQSSPSGAFPLPAQIWGSAYL